MWQAQYLYDVFRKDALQFSWQAQHFGRVQSHFAPQAQHFRRVQSHFAWQVQHFRRVVLRVFCEGLRQVATRCKFRGILRGVMKIDGSLARNIDLG